MGVATDAILVFGASFEDGFEFPWGDMEVDDWWMEVTGFVPEAEYPFDEQGNYKIGFSRNSRKVDAFYDEKNRWMESHPMPVRIVSHCSDEYPMFFIAAKEEMTAKRGSPRQVIPSLMLDTQEMEKTIREFLERFGIEYAGEICWWMASDCSQ
jgi:hypothetical protein